MSADAVLPGNVIWARKNVAVSGFGQRVAVDAPKTAAAAAPPSGEPSTLSDKDKLEKQLARRQVSGQSADRIKQECVVAFLSDSLFVSF